MQATSPLDSAVIESPAGMPMNREDIKSTGDLMRYELARFRSWRSHQDPQFHEWFVAVQLWQVERLKRTHAALLDDERFQAATRFFLSDMYGGLDLTELANEIERALPIATRLLPDSVMRTSVVALELNAITGELDEAVATLLFEKMGVTEINDDVMAEAYRLAGSREMRERQIALLRELSTGLDKYVRSRVIYATFKIANKPAHMAGLGALYDFLGRGFSVMRPMGSAQEFLDLFLNQEQAIMDRIYANHPHPFD
ncbi:MAG: hypothetical protein Q7T36_06315 [Fluviicoccus sp.]|uniref:FFLEELY motif protein n=1 Tax=Fluviicoccus sp. TaxID=2003552 RepID=UPI0027214638|nr:hypothetical protein [Fluviicoccus sp.]MDO8330067.1 hypothetical protein [Fluviicoccus sp.]